MTLKELEQRVKKIKHAYNVANRFEGYKTWGESEYTHGLSGDAGDLAKLVLAKRGFSFVAKDTERKIAKKIADCLFSLLAIAEEMDIEVEAEFEAMLLKLEDKVKERKVVRPTLQKKV